MDLKFLAVSEIAHIHYIIHYMILIEHRYSLHSPLSVSHNALLDVVYKQWSLIQRYIPSCTVLLLTQRTASKRRGMFEGLTKITQFENILRADEKVLRLYIWKSRSRQRHRSYSYVAPSYLEYMDTRSGM